MGEILTPLCELGQKYKTDKFRPHNYTTEYYRRLNERRLEVRKVLEIGIWKGRSLRMWEEFFPNARIYGIDNNPKRIFKAGRIECFEGDQLHQKRLAFLAKSVGGQFDVIVDDGLHEPRHNIKAMMALVRFLTKDGLYFIEDILGDPYEIARFLPPWFKHEVYEGEKPIVSGGFEKMLIISRC
jgi:hypothetical protein